MFSQSFSFGSSPFAAALPVPEWSLYVDGHVIAAAIVRDDPNIEAQITLDGQLLYRSRHATLASAAAELVALRGQWAREGWLEAS
jgi:hypothetical protein